MNTIDRPRQSRTLGRLAGALFSVLALSGTMLACAVQTDPEPGASNESTGTQADAIQNTSGGGGGGPTCVDSYDNCIKKCGNLYGGKNETTLSACKDLCLDILIGCDRPTRRPRAIF